MQDPVQLLRSIRARIRAIDMPREQIAPKLGVTYSWLCKFMLETTSNPRMNTLSKVLKGLEKMERPARKITDDEARAS